MTTPNTTPGQSDKVTSHDLTQLEEVVHALGGSRVNWKWGGEGNESCVLALIANQIHLLMDSAPVKPTGKHIYTCR